MLVWTETHIGKFSPSYMVVQPRVFQTITRDSRIRFHLMRVIDLVLKLQNLFLLKCL